MPARRISGETLADAIRAEVAEGVDEMLQKHGVAPGLAVVLVGDDPASAVYVRRKEQAAREGGHGVRVRSAAGVRVAGRGTERGAAV